MDILVWIIITFLLLVFTVFKYVRLGGYYIKKVSDKKGMKLFNIVIIIAFLLTAFIKEIITKILLHMNIIDAGELSVFISFTLSCILLFYVLNPLYKWGSYLGPPEPYREILRIVKKSKKDFKKEKKAYRVLVRKLEKEIVPYYEKKQYKLGNASNKYIIANLITADTALNMLLVGVSTRMITIDNFSDIDAYFILEKSLYKLVDTNLISEEYVNENILKPIKNRFAGYFATGGIPFKKDIRNFYFKIDEKVKQIWNYV